MIPKNMPAEVGNKKQLNFFFFWEQLIGMQFSLPNSLDDLFPPLSLLSPFHSLCISILSPPPLKNYNIVPIFRN